jgi:uncharacterized protein YqjF (DUF2071 family)
MKAIRRGERGLATAVASVQERSAGARLKLVTAFAEPALVGNWERVVFIHFAVPPDALQPHVPFPLDLFQGSAYVSLVAFSLRRLRPFHGGALTRWLTRPVDNHEFLNVRTYVVVDGEPGIHFIAEFLNNPLSVLLGPPTFSLPYQYGRLSYDHAHEEGQLHGNVTTADAGRCFMYAASVDPTTSFNCCRHGTRDEFLLERYSAFNACGRLRRFRVWHPPWLQTPIDIRLREEGLLAGTGPWLQEAEPAGAHYSPGATDVWMGRPHRLAAKNSDR